MSEERTKKPEDVKSTQKKSPGKGIGYTVEGPYCPVCKDLGFEEKMHAVTGIPVVAKNPQEEKGAPRVVDCDGGCRYSLEPYFNPKSDGTFCYMLIRSERDSGKRVNHYWFKPEWIGEAVEDTLLKSDKK